MRIKGRRSARLLVVVGEFYARGEIIQSFALARELGETLGIEDTPRCTSRFLTERDETEDAAVRQCATTDISHEQVAFTRHQAATGEPACRRCLPQGHARGNGMLCALQDDPIGQSLDAVSAAPRPTAAVMVAPVPSAPADQAAPQRLIPFGGQFVILNSSPELC